MPANTSPIFPLTPQTPVGKTLLTANTAKDGTGTVVTLFTAGANGGRVDYVKVRALGTNAATVIRLFINNGLTPATAANNSLFVDMTIAASTNSENSQLVDNIIQLDLSLPAGYTITATIGTTVAAGLQCVAVGGDY